MCLGWNEILGWGMNSEIGCLEGDQIRGGVAPKTSSKRLVCASLVRPVRRVSEWVAVSDIAGDKSLSRLVAKSLCVVARWW